MTTITKPFLQALRVEMNAALAEVAKKHGITILAGNCTFSEGAATFKVDVATGVAGGNSRDVQQAKAAAAWKRDSGLLQAVYGIDPALLHRSFSFAGKTYRIEGLLPASTRFPFLCSVAGAARDVKMSADHIRAGKMIEVAA